MCCDGGSSSPDPMIGQAAKQNADLAGRAFDWYKQAYEQDYKPRQQRMDMLTNTLVSDYLDTQRQNKDMAREQLARQKALFYPVEEKMVNDAMNYDSAARMEQQAGQAAADVNQQMSNARAQQNRSMAAYGLGGPDSGAFAATNARLTLGQALGAAGAENKARQDVQDKAIALRAGAANFGRGLGTQAAQGFGLSMQANAGAGGQQQMANQSALQGYGVMGQGFNTAMQGWNNAGNLAYQNTMANIQSEQANNSGMNALLGAGGNILGMWAGGGFKGFSSKTMKTDKTPVRDGAALRGVNNLDVEGWRYKADPTAEPHVGPYAEDFQREFGVGDGKTIDMRDAIGVTMKAVQDLSSRLDKLEPKKKANGGAAFPRKQGAVRGQGGPVDDKIPAMLSNGEYVLPADTTAAIGVDKLDKVVKQTHTPAAIQRRKAKKGGK